MFSFRQLRLSDMVLVFSLSLSIGVIFSSFCIVQSRNHYYKNYINSNRFNEIMILSNKDGFSHFSGDVIPITNTGKVLYYNDFSEIYKWAKKYYKYIYMVNPQYIYDKKRDLIKTLEVTDDFLKSIKINVIKGSLFTKSDKNTKYIVMTETASKKVFGNLEPLNKVIKTEDFVDYKVIGIIKDPEIIGYFANTQVEAFIPWGSVDTAGKEISEIRFLGGVPGAETALENYSESYTMNAFSVRNMSKDLNDFLNGFQIGTQFLNAFMIFNVLSSIIVVMGIVVYSLNQDLKKVFIKRVIGASKKNILNDYLLKLLYVSIGSSIFGYIVGNYIINISTLYSSIQEIDIKVNFLDFAFVSSSICTLLVILVAAILWPMLNKENLSEEAKA
ncbi:MAG: ABC transporter permease [Deinococcaceae bacterium]